MVNSKKRFEAVEGLIDAGEYFTINRARQYGKTTTLYMIWRRSADFNIDMTFHPEEIAQMLTDYEEDEHTGMNIRAVSEEIYK